MISFEAEQLTEATFSTASKQSHKRMYYMPPSAKLSTETLRMGAQIICNRVAVLKQKILGERCRRKRGQQKSVPLTQWDPKKLPVDVLDKTSATTSTVT